MKLICALFMALSALAGGAFAQERGLSLLVKELGPNNRAGRQYLLLIAIDRYNSWPPLKNPVKDAREIREILTSRYYVDETIELYDEKATKANIIKTFEGLQSRLKVNDSLLVVYAGHGHIDKTTNSGFWIPVNAGTDKYEQANWLPNTQIRGLVSNIKAIHLLIVSDSCFSGELLNSSRGLADEINSEYFKRAYARISRQILTSGAAETVPDESEFARMFKMSLMKNNSPYFDPLMLFSEIRLGMRGTMPMFGNIKDTGHQEGASFLLFLKEEKPEEAVKKEEPEKIEAVAKVESKNETANAKASEANAIPGKPFVFLTKYGGHAYYLYQSTLPWREAEGQCLKSGGHLVTIGSSGENEALSDALDAMNVKTNVWIGFSREHSHQWSWVNGEKSIFTAWESGQPDNSTGNQTCAVIWRPRVKNKWDDEHRDERFPFILEIEAAVKEETMVNATTDPAGLIFADEFDQPALNGRWSWVRENPSGWSLKSKVGFLALDASNGDLYNASNNCRNLLLAEPGASDFILETKLDFSPASNFHQAGLIVHVNDDNYLRLSMVHSEGKKIEIMNEIKGAAQYTNAGFARSSVYLRLMKSGFDYTAFYSEDGKTYKTLGTYKNDLGEKCKVGLVAFNNSASQTLTAYFDYFHVVKSAGVGAGFTEEFNSDKLAARWNWVRETPRDWSLESRPGSLAIVTNRGDLWEKRNDNKNILLAPVNSGDFTVETKVDIITKENFHLAGVLIYADDDNYVRVSVTHNERRIVEIVNETQARFSYFTMPFGENPTYLRLVKRGNEYAGYASADGRTYKLIAVVKNNLFGKLQAGLVANDTDAKNSVTAYFDYVQVSR